MCFCNRHFYLFTIIIVIVAIIIILEKQIATVDRNWIREMNAFPHSAREEHRIRYCHTCAWTNHRPLRLLQNFSFIGAIRSNIQETPSKHSAYQLKRLFFFSHVRKHAKTALSNQMILATFEGTALSLVTAIRTPSGNSSSFRPTIITIKAYNYAKPRHPLPVIIDQCLQNTSSTRAIPSVF